MSMFRYFFDTKWGRVDAIDTFETPEEHDK